MKFLIPIILSLFLCVNLFAHRVVVFGYAENGTVYTESTYPNGKPVKEGCIRVFSSDGIMILEGKSDEQGEFNFKIPSQVIKNKSDLKIELYAGEGHKEVWPLSFEDISASEKNHGHSGAETGDSLRDAPNTSDNIAGKIIVGLASIAIFFAVLYYIKRKLKI